jgi:hypothetical protein
MAPIRVSQVRHECSYNERFGPYVILGAVSSDGQVRWGDGPHHARCCPVCERRLPASVTETQPDDSPEQRQAAAVRLAPWLRPVSVEDVEGQIRAYFDHYGITEADVDQVLSLRLLARHIAENLAPLKDGA